MFDKKRDLKLKDFSDAKFILECIIGDLIVGVNAFECFEIIMDTIKIKDPVFYSKMDENYKIGQTRVVVFHIVLSLFKYIEFYEKYKKTDVVKILPKNIQVECKELYKILEKDKKIKDIRNKIVGHIWDKKSNSPITEENQNQHMRKLYNNDFEKFILWINDSNNFGKTKTVVDILSKIKDFISETIASYKNSK